MTTTEAFTGIRYGRCVAALASITSGAPALWVGRVVQAPTPLAAPAAVVLVIASGALVAHLGRLQIFLNGRGLSYRAGLGRRHHVSWSDVIDVDYAHVRASAIFGIGIPQTPMTLRYIVASGPSIRVHTNNGCRLWLSIPPHLTEAQLTTFRATRPCD